jgi:hypothetical protein
MGRIENANAESANAVAEAKASGLIDEAAIAHSLGVWWAVQQGQQPPSIVSGFRSPERQRQLIRRWRQGDRAGLVARPACSSWHTVGRAWDVSRPSGFLIYRLALQGATGVRWGGTFGDDVHFDMPTGQNPPNLCQSTF